MTFLLKKLFIRKMWRKILIVKNGKFVSNNHIKITKKFPLLRVGNEMKNVEINFPSSHFHDCFKHSHRGQRSFHLQDKMLKDFLYFFFHLFYSAAAALTPNSLHGKYITRDEIIQQTFLFTLLNNRPNIDDTYFSREERSKLWKIGFYAARLKTRLKLSIASR